MRMKMWQRQKNGKPGKWYCTFARGIHKSLGTADYDKALKVFNELEREHLRGRLIVLEKKKLMLFNDFKKEYLGYKDADGKDIVGSRQPNVSTKTFKADRLAVEKFGEWYGNRPLAGITKKKLKEYKGFLRTQKLQLNSVNNYIRHLRYALKEAVSCEYIKDGSNVLFLEFKQIKVPISQKIWLEEKDVLHLIETAQKSKHLEMRTIVPLMLYTGMPRQNVCDQIHITDKVIQYRRGKTQILIEVPIMNKLRPYIEHLGTGIQRLTTHHPDTVGHRFKEIAVDAGVGHISTHKVRHTFATLLLKAGVGIATVSKLLGHQSLDITLRLYGHVVDELKHQAMDKLNALLDG